MRSKLFLISSFTVICAAGLCTCFQCTSTPTQVPEEIEIPVPDGMVRVSARGEAFLVGSDDGDDDERPPRWYQFDYSFCIDSTEITQSLFMDVMGINPSKFDDDPSRPVEMVSWYDAVLFCNARSRSEGRDTAYRFAEIVGTIGNGVVLITDLHCDLNCQGYRLPTEEEWEYACRGGSQAVYFWGDSMDTSHCWYSDNAQETRPVAGRIPNSLSLYDMSGNVWEWTQSWYIPAGTDSAADSTVFRVMRGGSWLTHAWALRSANRYRQMPLYRGKATGFRTVLPY